MEYIFSGRRAKIPKLNRRTSIASIFIEIILEKDILKSHKKFNLPLKDIQPSYAQENRSRVQPPSQSENAIDRRDGYSVKPNNWRV